MSVFETFILQDLVIASCDINGLKICTLYSTWIHLSWSKDARKKEWWMFWGKTNIHGPGVSLYLLHEDTGHP